MSEAAPRVVRANNPSPMTLDGTRTFIVGQRRPVVIDPGPDDPAHLEAIERALGGVPPLAILLTPDHPDHAGGARALSARTGAPVRGGKGHPLEDGEEVACDGGAIRAIATPGHAPEHIAFSWTGGRAPGGGALFVGDLLMGQGDTTLVAWPEGDLADYLASLERVRGLAPGILYPAHGPPLLDPAAAVGRYRAHRVARLQQVAEARRALPGASAEELVARVYGPGLHPSLRRAAEGSVRAMIEFLRSRRSA